MGFFSKIKENINHGGVGIDFEAPNSVHGDEPSIPIVITLTNEQEARLIHSVEAYLQKRTQRPDGTTDYSNSDESASAKYTQSFTLQPNQPLQITLNVPLNIGNALQSTTDDPALQAIAGGLGKLQQVMQAASNQEIDYALVVQATVEGITLQPSKTKTIHILGAGQFGGSINLG